MKSQRLLIQAAAIADGDRVFHCPGSMLIDRREGAVLAVGSPESVGIVPDAETADLTTSVVIPALVNAHAHLDLTHIGPMACPAREGDGGFVAWVDAVRARRVSDPRQIRASVLEGVRLCIAGGTAFVGDIAGVGAPAAAEALRDSELRGVSYLEIFGQGAKEDVALSSLAATAANAAELEGNGVRIGLQPHAPYSCTKRVYAEAARCGLPLATHLAETKEELSFVQNADGPLAELLRRLGIWDDRIKPAKMHPLDHLADVLAEHPFAAAHLNYIDDRHLIQLAQWPISVVYCPRASGYFGHGRTSRLDGSPVAKTATEHRYRDMLDRGINVAIGTDSILCLDTPDRISVLDELRLLCERDGVDPRTLLRMATVNGARALGIDPIRVTFSPGAMPGILALPVEVRTKNDPLRQAITSPQSIAGLRFLGMGESSIASQARA